MRSFLADGVLINDGSGSVACTTTYYEYILLKFAPVYRPQDVYINELFGALSQLDDGVTDRARRLANPPHPAAL